MLLKGLQWLNNPYAYLDKQVARRGLTFQDKLPVLGQVVFTGDPEHVSRIAQDPNFRDKKSYSSLTDVLGKSSLIALKGDEHLERRKILSVGFRNSLLASYDAAVDRAVTEELAQPISRASAFEFFQAVNLKVTIQTLFGLGANDQAELVRLALKFMNSFSSPLNLFVQNVKFELGGLSPWGRVMANRRELVQFIKHKLKKVGPESVVGATLPLFRDGSVPEDVLFDELISLIMFGHDTTAAALSWAVSYLANSPDSVAQIARELEQAATVNGALEFSKLNFTEACLNESLRLSPPVVHLSRVAIKSTSLGKIEIAAGASVLPSAYIAHRNPDVFPTPEKFMPSRFFGEMPKGSFFPYGLGQRICIGKPMAQRQMTIVLASLVKNSILQPMTNHSVDPERHLVLIRPRGGGRVSFKPKQPAHPSRELNLS